MSFGIEGLHMCITEHYLLQAKLLKVFLNFKLFEGKNKIRIWPKEINWRMWRSRMQRPCSHKSLLNQEQLEAVKNAEVVMATLNGLPGSWNSFMWGMCARRKLLPSADWEEEEAQLIRREEKMGAIEDQDIAIQRRSLNQWGIWRTQLLKDFLSTFAFLKKTMKLKAQEGIYPRNK